MKLLLISVKSEVTRGGIAVWTEQFLSRCADADLDCRLVNTEITGSRATTGKRSLFGEFSRTRRIFRDLKTALAEGTVDAVHLNTSCGTFGLFRDKLLAKRIKKAGLPLVVHYHCDIPYWIHNGFSRRCLKSLAKLADRNLVLCENSERYLKRTCRAASVQQVPNFLNETLVLDQPKDIKERIERVGFVGRVSIAKGARALYTLAERFPEITFDLIGDVTGTVAEWDKPDNILLPGSMPHDEMIARLDLSDVFLFPSHSEGFSMALMEAMARGIPAIATDVGANAAMLDDKCGVVVAKSDIDAMERALASFNDASVRSTCSQKAIQKVTTCYTTNVVLTQLNKIYHTLPNHMLPFSQHSST